MRYRKAAPEKARRTRRPGKIKVSPLGSPSIRKALWGARRRAAEGLLLLGLGAAALANPSGADIRHGQVNITPGQEMLIQQLTDKAIVDWRSFSIGGNEAVRILQPGQLSVILNRVVGVDPSTILGRLEANGNVFLINPNGILFGPGSVVNVGGLVASTLSLSDQDFLSGRYRFTQDPSKELAAVVNQGTIRVTDGGYAVLAAPGVINEGTIIARAGKIALAAGERSTLNLDGRDLVHYTLAGDVTSGPVLLAPGMMSDALAGTLGIPEAHRADQLVRLADGSVRLTHGSGTLVQTGRLQADGRDGLAAGSVILDSADLTLVGPDSRTTASGIGDSDGGEVLLLSEMDGDGSGRGATILLDGATVAARGGQHGGDGGFVELSGDRVTLRSHPDLRAPAGQAGDFLLDPPNIRIVDGNDDGMTTLMDGTTPIGDLYIETQLGMGNFEIMSDTDIISQMSTGVSVTTAAPANLTLRAMTDIDLDDDVFDLGGGLNLIAGGGISLGSAQIDTGGGLDATATGSVMLESSSLNLNGGLDLASGAEINLGSAFIDSGDDTTMITNVEGAPVLFGDADLFSNGLTLVSALGDVDLGTSHTESTGLFTIGASRTTGNAQIDLNEAMITVTNGNGLTLGADGDILLGTSTSVVDSDISVISNGGNFHTEDGIMRAGLNPPGPVALGAIFTDVDGNITKSGSNSTGYLAADGILFLSDSFGDPSSNIDVNLNSTVHGAPIRVGGRAVQGVFIRDLGDQGLILVRQNGPLDNIGGTLPSISSQNGFVQLTSDGPITIGLATTVGSPANDGTAPAADPFILVQGGTGTVLVRGSQLLDGNNVGGPNPTLDIDHQNGGTVILVGLTGAVGGPGNDTIDVNAGGVNAQTGPGGGLYLTNANTGLLNSLVLSPNNADMLYVAGTNSISYTDATEVLDVVGDTQALQAALIIPTGNVLLGNIVTPATGQVLEIKALGGAISDNTGVAGLNIDTNGSLILSGQQGLGTAANPITVRTGGVVALSGGIGNIFLDAQGGLTIGEVAPPPSFGLTYPAIVGASSGGSIDLSATGALTVGTVTLPALNGIMAGSTLSLDAGGALVASSGVRAGTGADLSATGPVTLAAVSTASGNLNISSGGATVLNGLVKAGDDLLIDSAGAVSVNLAGDADANMVITSDGDIALAGPLTAGTSMLLRAGGGISHDASGALSAPSLGLQSDLDIGAAGDELEIDAATLTLDAGASAFVRDRTLGLSLGDSVSVGAASVSTGPVTGDLVLLTEEDALSIDAGLAVGGDLTLGSGVQSGSPQGHLNLNADVSAGGDAVLSSAADLVLAAGIDVSAGGDAVLAAGADLIEGFGATLSAQRLGLSAVGDVTGATGGDFILSADQLALQAGGQAFVRQTSGDLELVGSVSALGTNLSGGSVGTDMRVRVDSGNLTASSPYQADDLALVTGTALSTSNQTGPGVSDIILDADLTAASNLVLLSAGSIEQISGTVVSPNLGLGASNEIGSAEAPLSFNADNLAVSQTEPFLDDPDGFETTDQVTASAVTVSNQLVIPEPPEPPQPPEPPTPSTPVSGSNSVTSTLDPQGRLPEALSPDRAGRVEEAIDQALFGDDALGQERVLEWWENDDILRKKNRF